MINIPTETAVFDVSEVLEKWPLGSKVRLYPEFIKHNCGIYNPKINEIHKCLWTVLDYYYVIGTRATRAAALVVGIDYEKWATLQPDKSFVQHLMYKNMSDTHMFERSGMEVPSNIRLLRHKVIPEKMCILIVSDPETIFNGESSDANL